jgi:hypothetical protein
MILDYCKETNETLTSTLNESIIQVFYICDYIVEKRIQENKIMERIYKKH